MVIAIFKSFLILFILYFFSILFQVAGKLRLTIPLLYLMIAGISTLFTPWTSMHERELMIGLYLLTVLVAFSWFFSLVKVLLRHWKQKRSEEALADYILWQYQQTPASFSNGFYVDEDGHLLDAKTKQHIS